MNYESLKAKKVFEFFEQICNIPHGSGDEEGLSIFLEDFAKQRGLKVKRDEVNNVIITKEATSGYEDRKTVIVQSHIDMVCEKNKDSNHNFLTDPIRLIWEDDFLRADGTTLGADDGIGVAFALALLDSNEIDHPRLEALFTVDEERGLAGAKHIKREDLSGEYLINIDSEEEGIFVVGCAGGIRINTHIKAEISSFSDNAYKCFSLDLTGLMGGHSGTDISKERLNAIILLVRCLNELKKELDIKLCSIDGGSKDNAIPRECSAVVFINNNDLEKAEKIINANLDCFIKEASDEDKNVRLSLNEAEAEGVISSADLDKLLALVLNLPNGVQSSNVELGLPESSANVGVIETKENTIRVACLARSSLISKKYYLLERVNSLAGIIGAEVTTEGDYPAWEYKTDSVLRDRFVEVYLKEFEVEPLVEVIHAGLECGIFAKSLEGMDMISFGPNVYDAHTPQERVSISSVERMWSFFKNVIISLD